MHQVADAPERVLDRPGGDRLHDVVGVLRVGVRRPVHERTSGHHLDRPADLLRLQRVRGERPAPYGFAVPRLKKIAWLLTKRTKGRDRVVGLTFPQPEAPCGWERVLQPGDHVPLVAAKLRVPTIDSYGLERLDALMSRVWGRRLGLIVAPAGSGKTTLMSRFAATAGVPV